MTVGSEILAKTSADGSTQDDGTYQAGSTENQSDSENENRRLERSAQIRELAEYLWQNYIE